MRLSVVLPVRDGGAYLVHAVGSILTQTFVDFELLLIDDGSTDGWVEKTMDTYGQDARVRVLASPGSGLVDALNHGLSQSACDLVARMDSDDISLPDRFERQVAFLDAHPDIDGVGTQSSFMNALGNMTGGVTDFPTDPDRIAEALTTRGCVLKHPSVMFRKDSVMRVGGYRRALAKAEDYDLWLRMSEKGRLANLPEAMLRYREHPGQVSSGVNLDQRFGHDLSLISARHRRSGRTDPFDWIRFISYRDLDPIICEFEPEIVSLAIAYGALAYFEGLAEAPPSPISLRAVLRSARLGLLGDGRRYRALSLARAAKLSASRGDWRFAIEAAVFAFRLAPGRAFKLAFGDTSVGRLAVA